MVQYCVHKNSPTPSSVPSEINLVHTPRQPISRRSSLISSSHLCLCLTSAFRSSGFPSNTLYSPSLSSMRVTCLAHHIPLDLITGIVFGEYRLCNYVIPHSAVSPSNHIYIKVKWFRYRPGVAQRVGRGIAVLFHDRGTRRGWVVSSTPRPHFTPGKDPVPIVQEAGWAPGPIWTGGKSRPHRDSIPDRPAHSSVAIPTELPSPHRHIYIYTHKHTHTEYVTLSHNLTFLLSEHSAFGRRLCFHHQAKYKKKIHFCFFPIGWTAFDSVRYIATSVWSCSGLTYLFSLLSKRRLDDVNNAAFQRYCTLRLIDWLIDSFDNSIFVCFFRLFSFFPTRKYLFVPFLHALR